MEPLMPGLRNPVPFFMEHLMNEDRILINPPPERQLQQQEFGRDRVLNPKPGRFNKYDEATKAAAIERVRNGDSYTQIARDIDRRCSTSTIFKWVTKARRQGILPPEAPKRQCQDAAAAAQPQQDANQEA